MATTKKTLDERRAENDKKVASDIRKYGCHVITVFDPKGKQPNFSYSIGIQESSGAPDAIVIGLGPNLGSFIINEYNRRVKARKRFKRGKLYKGFIEGFSVYVEPTRPKLAADYTFGCERYYGDEPYSIVQIVWPSTSGVWSWEKAASQWLKENQPMLGRLRPNRP
jgi:hypothetical protein